MLADRLTAQLLAGPPAPSPAVVAERLLAIQAQDLRGAQLAIRARTRALNITDVDAALTEERSLVVTWLNRGTLHLVRSEDYPWLHALTAPTIVTGNASRLAQEGVTPAAAERGLQVVQQSLADDGPMTRAQLRARLEERDVPVAGQALVHILMLSTLRGITVRGPMAGAEQAYALVADWLGPAPHVDRTTALAELARRYLAGHGPASDRDLAKWSGLGLRDARAGLAAIASELAMRDDGLVDLARHRDTTALPPPRLLGPFEPLLMGWASREPVVGRHGSIVTSNGIFRAFALVEGRAAGLWRFDRGAAKLELRERVQPGDISALQQDAVDLQRFLRRAPSARTGVAARA